MDQKTVFVLGAGFTHAFCEQAPLLYWNITSFKSSLLKKYKNFPKICKLLSALHEDKKKRVNMEELISRLYSATPYDDIYLSEGERKVLYDDVFQYYLDIIRKISIPLEQRRVLDIFAKYVVDNQITCVTFNYDTILDQTLWEYKKSTSIIVAEKYWHPDGGYGFFCRPVYTLTDDSHLVAKDPTSMCLLKLHGSLNWKIKRGFQKPYPLDALIHEEDWSPPSTITKEDVSIHLESYPFVIPPVLDKSSLSEQPILKVIWENAHRKLREATEVVFIGYSLPKTDIAATFLFREALKYTERKKIFVVSYTNDTDKTIESYKNVFPKIPKSQFTFDGAIEWVKTKCSTPNPEASK